MERDCSELTQCKEVLQSELNEEIAYQEQMRGLVTQLKRKIYEVKVQRERYIRDINQGRKVYSNLQRMSETVTSDNKKI